MDDKDSGELKVSHDTLPIIARMTCYIVESIKHEYLHGKTKSWYHVDSYLKLNEKMLGEITSAIDEIDSMTGGGIVFRVSLYIMRKILTHYGNKIYHEMADIIKNGDVSFAIKRA